MVVSFMSILMARELLLMLCLLVCAIGFKNSFFSSYFSTFYISVEAVLLTHITFTPIAMLFLFIVLNHIAYFNSEPKLQGFLFLLWFHDSTHYLVVYHFNLYIHRVITSTSQLADSNTD